MDANVDHVLIIDKYCKNWQKLSRHCAAHCRESALFVRSLKTANHFISLFNPVKIFLTSLRRMLTIVIAALALKMYYNNNIFSL